MYVRTYMHIFSRFMRTSLQISGSTMKVSGTDQHRINNIMTAKWSSKEWERDPWSWLHYLGRCEIVRVTTRFAVGWRYRSRPELQILFLHKERRTDRLLGDVFPERRKLVHMQIRSCSSVLSTMNYTIVNGKRRPTNSSEAHFILRNYEVAESHLAFGSILARRHVHISTRIECIYFRLADGLTGLNSKQGALVLLCRVPQYTLKSNLRSQFQHSRNWIGIL